MKKITLLIQVLLIIFSITKLSYSQRHSSELIFNESGCTPGESCSVVLDAVSGKTRWIVDGDNLPTTGRDYFSGSFNTGSYLGFDSPNSLQDPTSNDLAWGLYEVTFECSADSFSRIFYLDLRCADWTAGYDYGDVKITYYPTAYTDYELKAWIEHAEENYISAYETIRVWDLADE